MRVTKGLHMDMPLVTFGDWLRLEDELAKISRDTLPFFVDGKKVETAKDLGLEVIGEDDTWEYICDKCRIECIDCLDLKGALIYSFWTSPRFWELIRDIPISSIEMFVNHTDVIAAKLMAQQMGLDEAFADKVFLYERSYSEELSSELGDLEILTKGNTYSVDVTSYFGDTGILTISDGMLIAKTVRKLEEMISEDAHIDVNLSPYDIGMILGQIAELALEDYTTIEVADTFVGPLMHEMAKLREKRSGKAHLDYTRECVKNFAGRRGMLIFDNASRGYCLPAKLDRVEGDSAYFNVISPINGSHTDFRRFNVEVPIFHISFDDVLAKRAGKYVFITESFVPEIAAEVINNGFGSCD